MTKFFDGPAKGQTLMLRRAPVFLRVIEQNGKFDALDHALDEPQDGERLYAYTLAGVPGHCHIRGTKVSGFYPVAEYKLVAEQPEELIMRRQATWSDWCHDPKREHLFRNLFTEPPKAL